MKKLSIVMALEMDCIHYYNMIVKANNKVHTVTEVSIQYINSIYNHIQIIIKRQR